MAFGSYQEGARVRSDFREEGGAFLATIPVPTFAAYQLDVIVAGHLVSVRGEGTRTAFRRSLDLPADADPDYVTASLTEGVLELRAPRKISLPHQVWVEASDGPISARATGRPKKARLAPNFGSTDWARHRKLATSATSDNGTRCARGRRLADRGQGRKT
jgi:hypothetical protein